MKIFSKNIYSKVENFSILIFKALGFYPLIKQQSTKNGSKLPQLMIQAWSIVVFLLVCINILSVVTNDEQVFDDISLGNANNILKYGFTNVSLLVFLAESFVHIRNFQLIFKKFHKVKNELKVLRVDFENYKTKMVKEYAIKFLIFITLETISQVYIVSNINWRTFWIVNNVPSFLCRIRHVQYIFFLHLIRFDVKIIQDELAKIVNDSKMRFFSCDKCVYDATLDRLQALKNAYGVLWNVVFDINEIFTWSITANILQNFVQIGCDSYWVYISLSRGTFGFFISCFNTVPTVVLLSLVLFEANRVEIDALKIPVQIHSIRKCKRECDLYQMVNYNKFEI